MTWSKYEITGPEANKTFNAIQDRFTSAWIAAGAPKDAAMYFLSETQGKDTIIYLSPAATVIFKQSAWEFQPCAKPSSAGLLVGDDRARF